MVQSREILDQAGVTLEDLSTWDGYEAAMEKVRALGGDTYGYAAGQGSIIMFNAMLASTEEGRELLESEMTQETIESKTFQEAIYESGEDGSGKWLRSHRRRSWKCDG